MRIGITGSEGFIGTAFRRFLTARGETPVSFPRGAFEDPSEMAALCGRCDALVHFAGLSRHPDGEFLLKTNLRLTAALINGLKVSRSHAHVYLASTTHEQRPLPYHESKRRSRRMLETWAAESGNPCTTLLMPNAFGPYARPFFNSVVSTFCYQAAQYQTAPLRTGLDRQHHEMCKWKFPSCMADMEKGENLPCPARFRCLYFRVTHSEIFKQKQSEFLSKRY